MERLFRPRWAGGWAATRVAYALVGLWTQLPRGLAIEDAYASTDMVFARGPFDLADHWVLTAESGYAVWGLGVLGLVMLLWGGRAAKPGLLLWLLASWVLMSAEALNIKAYDRLLTWTAFGMLLGPIGERGLGDTWRGPVGRWVLLVVFCGLYGSTGWLKLVKEPGWRSGETLAYHLLHNQFGGGDLAVWLSGQLWLTAPMSWWTVAFEALFPFLIWSRRANPWLLGMGVGMHLGIASLMNVGPFSIVALAAYPVLLHPEVGLGWWGRLRRWRASRRGSRRRAP